MARKLKTEKTTTQAEEDHALVLQQFTDYADTTISAREEAETARAYFDGHQWTEAERKALQKRGQPVITDNKIKDKIEYLLGVERKTRADPKAYPRNVPSDEKGAEAATDALRFVADENLFHYVRSDVSEDMFVEGVGGVEIVIDKKYGGGKRPKVCTRRIRWDRLYYDPHSMLADFSDKSYVGFITWMDRDSAIAKYPDSEDVIDAAFEKARSMTDTHDDKPRFVINTSNRKRVQIFSHYYLRKGVWYYCEFTLGGFLKSPIVSPYEDEHDEPDCPIELQAMYRDGGDGTCYGAVRRYKDLQDAWNKRGSKALHLLNTNRIRAERGAFEDTAKGIAEARQEAAKPDGVVLYNQGFAVEIDTNIDLAQGQMNLMLATGAALDATGPNAALVGQSGDLSGRAKQLDQQGGFIAIDKPFDSIRYLTLRIYRHIWNRIRQFWSAEMWIRVRDEEQIKFIALNRQITRGELIAEELAKANMPDEEKAARLAQVAADPEMRKPYVQNAVAEMDVDIVIEESPDIITLQQEQFGILAELAKSGAVPIPPRALIEASALRSSQKQKILDAISGTNDPLAARMAQLEMQLKELQAMNIEAKIRKTMSEIQKNEAAAVETQVDASVKVAEFTTDPGVEPKKQVNVN